MAASRVTMQGEANLIRNRGSMGGIFNMEDNVSKGYTSARPPTRVTHQAEENQVKSRDGVMSKYLNPVPLTPESQYDLGSGANTRVTMQAEPNYIKGQGTMGKWLNVDENVSAGYESARPAPRACPTVESQVMKEKAKGSMSGFIGMNSEYRPIPVERKIHPRGVPKSAAANAQPHKGKRMEMIMHEADRMPESPKRPGRVIRTETEYIAERHQGRPVANLISNYGNLALSERAPRVTVWGQDNQELDHGGRMKNLINDQQRLPPRNVRPVSAASTGEQWNISGDKVYGNKVDNYNKRNATQWQQEWK